MFLTSKSLKCFHDGKSKIEHQNQKPIAVPIPAKKHDSLLSQLSISD